MYNTSVEKNSKCGVEELFRDTVVKIEQLLNSLSRVYGRRYLLFVCVVYVSVCVYTHILFSMHMSVLTESVFELLCTLTNCIHIFSCQIA